MAGFGMAMGRAAVATALLTMGGCSSVPDSVNPAEWYRSASTWLSPSEQSEAGSADHDGATGQASGAVQPATQGAETESSFPSLASVPERPASTIDPAARGNLVETMRRGSEEGRREAQALGAQADRLVDSRELPPRASAAASQPQDAPRPPQPAQSGGAALDGGDRSLPQPVGAAATSALPTPETAPTAPHPTAAFVPGQPLAPRPPVMPPQPASIGMAG